MTYAYARISSRDQNLDRQLSAFRSFPSAFPRNISSATRKAAKTPNGKTICALYENSSAATCSSSSPLTGWGAVTT